MMKRCNNTNRKKYIEEVLKLATTSPNTSGYLGQLPIKENTPAKTN